MSVIDYLFLLKNIYFLKNKPLDQSVCSARFTRQRQRQTNILILCKKWLNPFSCQHDQTLCETNWLIYPSLFGHNNCWEICVGESIPCWLWHSKRLWPFTPFKEDLPFMPRGTDSIYLVLFFAYAVITGQP